MNVTPGTTGVHAEEKTAPKTVTLRRSTIAEVEALTGKRGFSAAAEEALSQWAARRKVAAAIADYESRAGVITDEEMAALRAEWGEE